MSIAFFLFLQKQNGYAVYIKEIKFGGLERTSEEWIRSFLAIDTPFDASQEQLYEIKQKILTTGVFSSVDYNLRRLSKDEYDLTLICKEKHTIIPVLRGQFGGGTPLRVIGFYDTHFLGELWTIGAEARQYDSLIPGWVVYTKAPRWKTGHHQIGFEVWQDIKLRQFYNSKDQVVGHLTSKQEKVRFHFLIPMQYSNFQIGSDVQIKRTKPWKYNSLYQDSLPILPNSSENVSLNIYPTFIYDSIIRENINYDGLRLITRAGLINEEAQWFPAFEHESFYYKLIGFDLNIAAHLFVGWQNNNYLSSQYFLGGFDSIRGLPDGVIFGPKAVYANLESRYLFKKFDYLWLQGVTFFDSGYAGQKYSDIQDNLRSSYGFGLRFSVPQVYRMEFRIDYAFSLDRPGTRGISAGMNQFFEPFRPL